jgi:hypothetical protein
VTVHLVKTNPNPIPPPPDDNVIKGYNPFLIVPRPSTLENYLRAYDVVFLLDDSGSVAASSLAYEYATDILTDAGRALDRGQECAHGLANYIIDKGWDSDGIDLCFLNSNSLFQFKTLTGIQVRL